MKEMIEQAIAEADEVRIEPKDSELSPEAQHQIQQVELAHQNYELCSPKERLWVLENCPERLFLEYGIAERKLVQEAQRQLQHFIATNVTLHDICPTIQ